MTEPIMFYQVTPEEFYKTIRAIVESVWDAKSGKPPFMPPELAEKTLLLPAEVCIVLRISKTTLYNMIKEGKLKGFHIQRKRYFARTDVEKILKRQFG